MKFVLKFKKKYHSIFFWILFVMTIVFPLVGDIRRFDLNNYFLFTLISCFSLVNLFFLDSTIFSLNKTFHIFYYFFFGLAPLLQYQNVVVFFEAKPLVKEAYFDAGLWLLIAQLLYIFLYTFWSKNFNTNSIFEKKGVLTNQDAEKDRFRLCLIISIIAFLFFLYLIDFKMRFIISSPYLGWQKHSVKHGLLGYACFLVVRVLPIISYLYFHLKNAKEIKWNTYNLSLLVLVSLTSFPTSIPRSLIATFYIPIIYLNFKKYFSSTFYVLIYFVGFFIIFPIANYFRNGVSTIDLGVKLFLSAHMDAFVNWATILHYKINTTGQQLLGSIFFFIPNHIWKNRPLPTGHILSEVSHQTYDNVAIPLFAEGYVNFGFFGFFLTVILISIFNYWLDFKCEKNKFSFKSFLFYFFLGFEFYLMRGDLYSSLKFIYSFITAFIVFWTIIRINNFRKKFF